MKQRLIKYSLYMVVLFVGFLLAISIGSALLSSSAELINVANNIQSIPVIFMFCLRLCIYTGLYFSLPMLIRKKRPTASPKIIQCAQNVLLRILLVYELLFGINIVNIVLGA